MAITIIETGDVKPLPQDGGCLVTLSPSLAITVIETFSRAGKPLVPASGFPKCYIMDGSDIVTSGLGYQIQNTTIDEWRCDLVIPSMFDMQDKTERNISVVWEFETVDGSVFSPSMMATVTAHEIYDGDDEQRDLVELVPCTSLNIKVPYVVRPTIDDAQLDVYYHNELVGTSQYNTSQTVGSHSLLNFTVNIPNNYTQIPMPATMLPGANLTPNRSILVPLNLVVTLNLGSGLVQRKHTLRLFAITPSVLDIMESLNRAINKANQQEAIASLRYLDSDLLEALRRGLDAFNSFKPTLTGFDGSDMRGVIREGWMLCSIIAALRAQSLAESMFSFDFSGQAISLNVDRAQAVETALQHYESQRDSELANIKKILGRRGVIAGSGASGEDLTGAAQPGMLGLSNTPMTRIRTSRYPFRRWW